MTRALNSLSHQEYIPAAARLLGGDGRFAEIGKRGIWSRIELSKQQLVGYRMVAMDSQCSDDPVWQGEAVHNQSRPDGLQDVKPLPLHVFELQSKGVEAFRVLQRANQIGKVVVSMRYGTAWQASSNGFTVSGGTGGLGMLVGQRLLEGRVSTLSLLTN